MLLTSTASGFILAAACLLPQTAAAVPIQAANSAQATASTSASDGAASTGPRRPGGISATSQRLSSSTSADRGAGPRRPVPGQHEGALTAEK